MDPSVAGGRRCSPCTLIVADRLTVLRAMSWKVGACCINVDIGRAPPSVCLPRNHECYM